MQNISILFGRPWKSQLADDRFELEALAAEELDIDYASIPLDPVVNGDPERVRRYLPKPAGRTWLYRGWMLSAEEYSELYDVFSERDEELFVDPESAHAPYADVELALPSPQQFAWLGDAIASPFFTADVARLTDGTFTIIEVNDGGCSTLPEQLDPRDLYRALLEQ